MANFLDKLKIGNKEVFNTGMETMKSNAYFLRGNDDIKNLLNSIISSGAIGSWLEYPEVVQENRVILGETTVYSIIVRNMLQSDNDIANAIMYMIKRNIESGLLDENTHFEEIQNFNLSDSIFKNRSVINAALRSETYYESFINLYRESAIKRIQKDSHSIAAIRNMMSTDFETFQRCHKEIKESFLDKKDSYTEDDIAIIISALTSLEIDPEVCQKVKNILTYNLQKRKAKELKRQTNERKITEAQPKTATPKETLSKKEYNTIYRELLSYYDFDKQQPIRMLTIKEVIYCLRLMIKINMAESTIDRFLKDIDRENKKSDNPISLYIALYEKIKHYAADTEISKKVALIEEYFAQIFIATDEDYEFWKSMIGEELEAVTTLLPNDGTYEKEAAKAFK